MSKFKILLPVVCIGLLSIYPGRPAVSDSNLSNSTTQTFTKDSLIDKLRDKNMRILYRIADKSNNYDSLHNTVDKTKQP